MVEKDLLFVDKETKDAIVDELWNDILSSQNLTSQQSPKAYMLGGQPGAGKLTSTRKLAAHDPRQNIRQCSPLSFFHFGNIVVHIVQVIPSHWLNDGVSDYNRFQYIQIVLY